MTLKQKQLLALGGGAILLLIVIVSLVVRTVTTSPNTVEVIALPEDSTITLDGKPIKAGRITLSPGKHTFTVSRQDFKTATRTVDRSRLPDDKKIYLLPIPESNQALAYLENHPEIQDEREKAGGLEAAQAQKYAEKNYPILKELPYTTDDYSVNYNLDPSLGLTLYVTYSTDGDSGKTAANKWLTSKGVDLKKVKVVYENPRTDYDISN